MEPQASEREKKKRERERERDKRDRVRGHGERKRERPQDGGRGGGNERARERERTSASEARRVPGAEHIAHTAHGGGMHAVLRRPGRRGRAAHASETVPAPGMSCRITTLDIENEAVGPKGR